ncbi:hypothetical protein TNCV_5059601 [Trichonephila clavipes]|nr:hypothetical protein TNCV_5059601 [Trichonephila clavipes]
MRSHMRPMVFRSGEPALSAENVKSSQAAMNSPYDMGPVIVLLVCRDRGALQQGQNNRLHKLCDVAVRCQMAFNVYQRHPVIHHYAFPQAMKPGVVPV